MEPVDLEVVSSSSEVIRDPDRTRTAKCQLACISDAATRASEVLGELALEPLERGLLLLEHLAELALGEFLA